MEVFLSSLDVMLSHISHEGTWIALHINLSHHREYQSSSTDNEACSCESCSWWRFWCNPQHFQNFIILLFYRLGKRRQPFRYLSDLSTKKVTKLNPWCKSMIYNKPDYKSISKWTLYCGWPISSCHLTIVKLLNFDNCQIVSCSD